MNCEICKLPLTGVDALTQPKAYSKDDSAEQELTAVCEDCSRTVSIDFILGRWKGLGDGRR